LAAAAAAAAEAEDSPAAAAEGDRSDPQITIHINKTRLLSLKRCKLR